MQKVQAQLGAGFSSPAPSATAAAFYVPSSNALRPPAPRPPRPRDRASVEPARPRTYYRWRDERGLTHVAEAPPPEGTVYSTVRALD